MGFLDDMMKDFDLGRVQAEFERRAAELRQAAHDLEHLYADRGLKFTEPFHGGMPVQAYGYVDGMRFYFRFRRNNARLYVGPYSADLEEKIYRKSVKQTNQAVAEAEREYYTSGTDQAKFALAFARSYVPRKAKPDDSEYFPEELHYCSEVKQFSNEPYKEHLEAHEAYTLFIELMDGLEKVHEDERISRDLKRWLDS